MATSTQVNAFKAQVAADVENRSFTVGTFNVNQYVNQNPTAVQEAMHIAMRAGASVVGVQEYCEFWNLPTNTSKIPGVYDYVSSGLVDNLSWGNGWTGNAIVSKHDLTDYDNGVFAEELPDHSKAGFVKNRVIASGKKVSVYNTHFYAYGSTHVKKQAEELAKVIKADPTYYKVITGDFNVDNLDDIKALTDLGFQPAFPFSKNQIDNILALPFMPVTYKGKVSVPGTVSDHDFYYATFRFN